MEKREGRALLTRKSPVLHLSLQGVRRRAWGAGQPCVSLCKDHGARFLWTQNASFPGWSHKELQEIVIPILAAATGWMVGVVCHQISPGLWA